MIQLEINNIYKNFGGLQVLKAVSLKVEGPELIGLIGPNGAGKTTLTNILDGVIKPTSGTVYLNGKRIDPLPPYKVAQAGFGRTFQVTRAFRRMTVLENLYVPALAMNPTARQRDFRKRAGEVLEFLTMEHLRNEYAQALSGGQQKLLVIAFRRVTGGEVIEQFRCILAEILVVNEHAEVTVQAGRSGMIVAGADMHITS